MNATLQQLFMIRRFTEGVSSLNITESFDEQFKSTMTFQLSVIIQFCYYSVNLESIL